MKYQDMQFSPARKKLKERKDCTVICCALAARVDYATAHDELRMAGRKPRQGFSLQKMLSVVESLGRPVRPVKNEAWRGKIKTMITAQRHLPRGEEFIIVNPTHVAFWDGEKIQDWSDQRHLRVERLYRVADSKAQLGKQFELHIPAPRPRKDLDGTLTINPEFRRVIQSHTPRGHTFNIVKARKKISVAELIALLADSFTEQQVRGAISKLLAKDAIFLS